MYSIARASTLAAVAIVTLSTNAFAGSPLQASQTREATGSISGRVTLADQPASGVSVMLTSDENNRLNEKPVARTTTDPDGRFQLTNVAAGRYQLQTFTPAFVAPSDTMRRPGAPITLVEGEAIEGIDVALMRGGVITGKVTDGDARALVQESVRVFSVDERGQRYPVYLPFAFMFTTDDRGVYRLFGVPPGRYVVCAGIDTNQNYARMGAGKSYHPLTYHPNSPEPSRATVIEVTAGSEATGIDITVGQLARAFAASGRIITADTGKPVAGMNFGYGSLNPDGNSFTSSATSGMTSNSRGEFRLEGILPGHYAAFASSMEATDIYSDSVSFQITDGDVGGLEIKVHRGSSLSGVVTIEGAGDQEGVPKISELRLAVGISSRAAAAPRSGSLSIAPDGSFQVKGLQPGNAHFYFNNYPLPKGISLVRVERDGVEQQNGVEVAAGEQVSGVRLIIGYGSGVIRGQVKMENGTLPEASRLYVTLRRTDGKPLPQPQAIPDTRGRFVFEGLLPADYDIIVIADARPAQGVRQARPKTVKQTVSVTNEAETQVTLIIDLNENKQ